jgi:phytol kinase
MSPWIGITVVMVTLMVVIHALSRLQKNVSDPEVIRKLLHVVMGLVTLSFPLIFQNAWPVLTLSIISSLFIAVLKVSKLKEWAPVVCAQGRESIGEIVFPLAVGLTFLIANGNVLLYAIPILILTFADTASALVGQRFGKKKYGCTEGHKSIEGSFAFATVAFVSTFLPLMQFSDLGIHVSLSIALILAIVAMMFEAIAWKGLDNLFIPIGAFIVLKTHMLLGLNDLHVRLALLLVISTFVLSVRKNSTLNGAGVIGSALFCYFAYTVGGIEWTIMPILLYLSYRFLLPARFRQIRSEHSVYAVVSVASAGVFWLLMTLVSNSEKYIFPYMLTFGAHAAIIATAHLRYTSFSKERIFTLLYAILKAWCLMAIPMIFINPSAQTILLSVFLAPFCIGIPTILFYAANSTEIKPFTRPSRWWKQASFAALASALGLIPLLIH